MNRTLLAMLASLIAIVLLYPGGGSASCPFSSDCECQKAPTFTDFSEISCKSIPLSLIKGFPGNRLEKLEVNSSNLLQLDDELFGQTTAYTLHLHNDGILSLSNKTFMNMKSTLRELSLDYNDLSAIPVSALASLEILRSLNLNGNLISSVLVNWFNLKDSLTDLKLSNNDIDSIPLNPESSLANIKGLTALDLSGNLLMSIEANSLPYSIKILNASNNYFKNFPNDLFNVQQDLETLDLSYNFIEDLDENKFRTKINLDTLNLSGNKLKRLRKSFGDTIKINKYILSSNNITEIEKDAFSDLECKEINLSRNRLWKLGDNSFKGVDSSLESLDLSYNNFSKIPDGLKDLKNLRALNLAQNHLSKVKNSLYYFNRLTSLSLSGNLLGVFPVEALGPLRSLAYLDLSYNSIADVRKSDFKSWGKNLERLFLHSNSLFFLGDNTFEYTPKLTELSLSFNSIGDMSLTTFKNLEKIEKLHLSFSLKGYGFPNPLLSMKSLSYLALDNNNVNSISKEITKLEKIKTLILDFNRIKEIESSTFDSKAHKFLTDIRLSFNYINKIDSNIFSELNSLESVSLHNNKIMKISEFAFINLPEKLTIYLSSNKINSIDKHAFSSLPRLKMLDLHGNELLSFDFNFFHNVTSETEPMSLNISWNRIETLNVPDYTRAPVYVQTLDVSHNKISKIPEKIVEIQTALRVLDISFNELTSIDSQDFYGMVALESLNIAHNKILSIKNGAFVSLKKLSFFNISHNHIEELFPDFFSGLESLKVIDLSFNDIRTISVSAFDNTMLEQLILSNNKITYVNPSAFSSIGKTLRTLNLNQNLIDLVDSTFLESAVALRELNMCHNNITSDHLHALRNTSLLKLHLCNNRLGKIPHGFLNESVHLYELNLDSTGLESFPNLTLPNLAILKLSDNKIKNISEVSLSGLGKLRSLSLRMNDISSVSGTNWIQLPNLRHLDLSHNPIKVLDKPCFFGLYNLRQLRIQHLTQIEHLESGIFMDLDKLTELKIDFSRRVGLDLNQTLAHLKYLKSLSINVLEHKFVEDLPKELPWKLRYFEITGSTLKYIDQNSLKPLKRLSDLKLRISGTSIVTFSKHFFNRFKGKNFEIDLSNNEIEKIGPELLYFTLGDVRRHGTKAFSGGIHVHGNKLTCGCAVKWFAEWLRRYLVETVAVNGRPASERLAIVESLNRLTCSDEKTKESFPILTYDLTTDEKLCGLVLNVPKPLSRDDTSEGSAPSPAYSSSLVLTLFLAALRLLSN